MYRINVDGSNLIRLTENDGFDVPAPRGPWSPDSSLYLFMSTRDGSQWEVYIMNPDGTAQTNLSNDPATDWNPEWSEDGTQITFESNRGGDSGDFACYIVKPNGSDLHPCP